jgi:voltage-gated potassium channel
MSGNEPNKPAQLHVPPRRLAVRVALRSVLSVAALSTAYFLIPVRAGGSDVPFLILELCVFIVIVAVQVPAVVRATHPILRAAESLAILVPFYLLIFARVYLSSSAGAPSSFSEPLSHVSALYFTVTVFATVGFGDVTAQSDGMRLLVTLQMLLNLALLGLGIRVLTAAARRGVAQRGQKAVPALDDEPGGL